MKFLSLNFLNWNAATAPVIQTHVPRHKYSCISCSGSCRISKNRINLVLQISEAATKLCGSKKTSEGSTKPKGFITLGYRGTFTSGRGDLADVKFRKLNRILICGRVGLCREAFGDTLNETRDPDRGSEDRYSARLFLKHSSLEKVNKNNTRLLQYQS